MLPMSTRRRFATDRPRDVGPWLAVLLRPRCDAPPLVPVAPAPAPDGGGVSPSPGSASSSLMRSLPLSLSVVLAASLCPTDLLRAADGSLQEQSISKNSRTRHNSL